MWRSYSCILSSQSFPRACNDTSISFVGPLLLGNVWMGHGSTQCRWRNEFLPCSALNLLQCCELVHLPNAHRRSRPTCQDVRKSRYKLLSEANWDFQSQNWTTIHCYYEIKNICEFIDLRNDSDYKMNHHHHWEKPSSYLWQCVVGNAS